MYSWYLLNGQILLLSTGGLGGFSFDPLILLVREDLSYLEKSNDMKYVGSDGLFHGFLYTLSTSENGDNKSFYVR